MGKRKQSRPIRSGGIIGNFSATDSSERGKLEDIECLDPVDANERDNNVDSSNQIFIDIDHGYWDSAEHFDIAEVILTDARFADGFSDYKLIEDLYREAKFSLRFRLCTLDGHSFILGHWPVISAGNIFLEFVVLETCSPEEKKMPSVLFSGTLDGPDEGVSGMVHLISQKLLILRPVSEIRILENSPSFRMRVEILKSAFDACQSLLENTRQPWKKSMMNVMAWLRPEVTTQEAKYGLSVLKIEEIDECPESAAGPSSRKQARFDAAEFYEAIKPSKGEPMLEENLPELLPQLRPYQRRASHWMVQREKGMQEASERSQHQFFRPLSVPVDFLDMHSRMFYNPFSGNVSLHPESFSSHVPGGILADEMGLGKTVELLACIIAHPKTSSVDSIVFNEEIGDSGSHKSSMRRLKRERVECICGAVAESPKYKGLWVQCDMCDAWQHADCVGYSPSGKPSGPHRVSEGQGNKKNQSSKSKNQPKKNGRTGTEVVLMDGNYICALCCELIEATDSAITAGATLIVCPSPILQQWHAEIIRHTKPGSLRICVYEGVRNFNPTTASRMDMNELASADIVLTTYDVLKEDLSHDSDRHDGDRRFMRFHKRYPVVPTPLTRIYWWRVCLDEAQMVESNTAAATEMALRLHTQYRWCITGTPIQRRLDDLYGLLHFLGGSPFDVHRWWVEVIRDPYESGNVGAMEFTHKYFKQIMWRSSKAHISDELQLPPQEECLSWLAFSAIEAHFYQKQHETCVSCAHEVIRRIKDENKERKLESGSDASSDPFLAHGEAAKLMHSLLKLRQACCHPQVGSSGLRSLQQAPMTMEEILEVLVGKSKIEGEEALRKVVIALNGLAGVALIEQDIPQAVSLYREALGLAEENFDDFRLDPLLNLHIHHNLSELLPTLSEDSQFCTPMGGLSSHNPGEKNTEFFANDAVDEQSAKRQKIGRESSSDLSFDNGHLEDREKLVSFDQSLSAVGLNGHGGMKYDVPSQASSGSFCDRGLRKICENIKQKYLSVFISKLSLAQKEFTNSYTQVSDAFIEFKRQHATWWLEALELIGQNKDLSNDLMRKIEEAVSGSIDNSKASRLASRLRSISGLQYFIQTGLDSLENSRQEVLERLLEIDQTMGRPREEDIERVRYCPSCQDNSKGHLCIHCELNELFQIYEARLFRLKKGDFGAMIASAEEAVDLQKKKFALNRFFGALSQADRRSIASNVSNQENKRQRDIGANVVTSRSPSELEVILGVLKSSSRALLGREGVSSSTKHLLLFESMRKEYVQARALAIAQAQILRAYDEIKMATSRLRLKESEDDNSAIDALSSEELAVASVQFSNDKFLAMSSLSHIKGQLRYLKGLVLSNQKTQLYGPNTASLSQDTANLTAISKPTTVECPSKPTNEACPICHENLTNQKMVLQCGHVLCCKCFVELTEKIKVKNGKTQGKWVMCPTCRQRTDFGNIAYADDSQNKTGDCGVQNTFEDHGTSEMSIVIKGSYGTKIEAVTRRILWIRSTDPEAKVLVFSSWNDVLDVLGHALNANNIAYVRMKGGRKAHAAIAQFKGQKSSVDGSGRPQNESAQVLLILIQHGANGLNILEAQHVILVEPLLNPAAEAQAVNRVHRIGQEKTTFVHRFIVKDTVEEGIYKLNRSRIANPILSGNMKNQDQRILTIKDVESLFSPKTPAGPLGNGEETTGSLRHLPPAVAAALAAEKRLKECST